MKYILANKNNKIKQQQRKKEENRNKKYTYLHRKKTAANEILVKSS